MQMIERNRRLVKDRRQRGQSPGAWAAALRKRLFSTELHHLDAGELQSAVHELMKTYVDHPPRKLQSEGYSGPITLSQFERFQWARDKLKEGGLSLPMRLGIEPRPVLSGRVTAATPLELEPLVKGARIPELCDIFLHKAETGPMIISDDKPVDRIRSAAWPGRRETSSRC
jgi:hypothetical protein